MKAALLHKLSENSSSCIQRKLIVMSMPRLCSADERNALTVTHRDIGRRFRNLAEQDHKQPENFKELFSPATRKAITSPCFQSIQRYGEVDLPLNFHPCGTRALRVDTPIGVGGSTDIRAELSDGAARVSVAVSRRSANALGV